MPEIPDNFKRKKRRKRLAEYDEETEYFDDNDDFWDFYPDYRNVTEMDIARIDFAKHGQVSTSKSQQIVKSNSLPDTIYCDLVTTLPTKCLQECNPYQYFYKCVPFASYLPKDSYFKESKKILTFKILILITPGQPTGHMEV